MEHSLIYQINHMNLNMNKKINLCKTNTLLPHLSRCQFRLIKLRETIQRTIFNVKGNPITINNRQLGLVLLFNLNV